jgi:phosphohistidine phosphatase
MKRLYLLRHAKSSWKSQEDGDHERPLAPRGVAATERLTRYLHAQGTTPNVVLCSSARRARETLEGIANGLSGEPTVTIDSELYGASAEQLLDRIRQLPDDVESAMVIGHNPGLHELAILLAGERAGSRLEAFPAGTMVTLDVSTDTWADLREAGCVLEDYVAPRELV